jgi:predicted esterase
MKHFIQFAIIICLLLNLNLFAQETGSFNKTIQFNGFDRTISFYVPNDYNAEKSYKLMVCLHGLGDNSTNFRNALISSLKWNTFMEEVIFACPDGGTDQNKDFYTPEGDEQIIQRTIDFAKQMYNIDTTKIYLEGFSLGGRSALKYSLDNPEKFYGVLLNTPALQGVEDARKNPLVSIMYNYQNASKLKIAVSYGEEDFSYYYPVNNMFDSLVANNGIAMIQEVAGMGHSVASQIYMNKCFVFFDNPNPNRFDLEFYSVDNIYQTCNDKTDIKLRIRNLGNQPVNNFEVTKIFDGSGDMIRWDGNLLPNHYVDFTLSNVALTEGENFMVLRTGWINVFETDGKTSNDEQKTTVYYYPIGDPIPQIEDFESEEFPSSNKWQVSSASGIMSWEQDTEVGRNSSGSMFTFNTIFLFYNAGLREEFITPILDLSNNIISQSKTANLYFDVAYNYHKYTPPYFTADVIFTDTLEVLISTDCGETFKSIYRKSGAELATAPEPILNPLSIQACFFIPNANQWRTEKIDLADYSQSLNAIIKFSYISGLGGSINIDNIIIGDETTNVNELGTNEISLAPNPADEYVNISLGGINDESVSLVITDILGNEVKVLKNIILKSDNEQVRINTADLHPGFYLLNIKGKFGNKIEKLIIK